MAFWVLRTEENKRGFSVARTMARDRPSPYDERKALFYRSAGACPPQSLECADAGEGNCEGSRLTMKGAFCRRCPGRRAALLHRDQEVSPTRKPLIYDHPLIYFYRVSFFTNWLDKIAKKVIESKTMQIFRGISQKFDIPRYFGENRLS